MEYLKHLLNCNSGDYFGYLLLKEKSVWEDWHFDHVDSCYYFDSLAILLDLSLAYEI